MIRRLVVVVALATTVTIAMPAHAFQVHGGWIHADLGLDQGGDGFTLGVGQRLPLGTGPFDFTFTAEYLQKRGTQPMAVSNPEMGPVIVAADVTLSCLQPAVFLGWTVAAGPVVPRFYGGASVSLKMSESWERLAGDVGVDYSYEDVDFLLHLGATLHFREQFFLDFRFSQGLMEQVIVRDGSLVAKADDSLEGVKLPVDGDTVSSYQLGLGITFR